MDRLKSLSSVIERESETIDDVFEEELDVEGLDDGDFQEQEELDFSEKDKYEFDSETA